MNDPTPVDTDILERVRRIATSTWSDALDALKVDGVIEGLTVRSTVDGPVAGTAVTVRERVHELDPTTTPEFDVGRILNEMRSGTFFAIDAGGANISTFGGLAAMAAERGGARGVVIDGACRDLAELRRSGLWVASRHVTPRSGKGRIQVDAVNTPVTIGGVLIEPGDVLIGDSTGIVRVPQRHLQSVLAIAEDLTARDARFAAALHGDTFSDAVKRLGSV